MPSKSPKTIIPPLSVVRVKASISDWGDGNRRIYRIGYYGRQDGLDCVWLVDDSGKYIQTVDQEMIGTHFDILESSRESDLFGDARPIIGPRLQPKDEPT